MATTTVKDINGWYWDKTFLKYWRYQVDATGQYDRDADGHHIRVWQTEDHAVPSSEERAHGSSGVVSHSHATGARRDSQSRYDPNMAPAAPDNVKDTLVFKGTPENGWYEPLDSNYRMRTRAEVRPFFKPGRVFAMLWSETASATTQTGTENSRYTSVFVGKHKEGVYCSIRRFVVVRASINQYFVEACAITTYGKRGTLKPGCNPSEHTIVYLEGGTPNIIDGEFKAGMRRNPIAISPTDPNEKMDSRSRLRLGKIYSIECNVKVRDIGMIVDRTTFLRYHQEVRNDEFEPESLDMETPRPTPAHLNVPNGNDTRAYTAPPSQSYGHAICQQPSTYHDMMQSQGFGFANDHQHPSTYAENSTQAYDERPSYSDYTSFVRTDPSYGGVDEGEQASTQAYTQGLRYPPSSSSPNQQNGHPTHYPTYPTNTYPFPPGY